MWAPQIRSESRAIPCGTMAPSGGPSTSFGGGVPALSELTEELVRSWNRTQLHAALFEYRLLDDARFDDDPAQLRGRLLAHARAQAAAFQALAQQPTGAPAGAPSGVQAGALAPPVHPGRTGAPSPVTAFRHRPPSTSEGEHPSVPFGTGPYVRPRHCVTPTQGRNLQAAFAAEEDSPPRDDLFAALDQEDTRRENATDARAREARTDWPPRPWTSMGFGDDAGVQDTASEVSMGVSESEMYRARVTKRRLDDRSPQKQRDYGGRTRQIRCPSPPDDFGDGLLDGRFGGDDVLGNAGLSGRAATTPPPHHSELPAPSGVGAAPHADPGAPPIPPRRPDYADPSKLSKRQRDLLRRLPVRPTTTTLMGLSDAALQCLLYANGLRRDHGATKRDYAASLRALLDREPSTFLAIPEGLDGARGPTPPPRSRSPPHRPPSESPGPRCTAPEPRGAPQGAGAPNAPPPPPRRPPSPSNQHDARAGRQSDQHNPPDDAAADNAAIQRLRPALAAAEHALAECARFLRALPRDATSPDAVLALVSDAERAYDLVRSAHGGLAAGALAESLRVASATRRSYADVCSGGGARGANDQRLPRQQAPNLARSGTRTSTAQHSAPRTSAANPPGASPANAAWITARCVILRPQAQDARKAPTRIQAFVQAAENFSRKKFRNLARIPRGKVIELARRTRRGEYVLQFWPEAWSVLQLALTSDFVWDLGAPLGAWHSVPSSAHPPLSAIVLTGVESSWTPEALLAELRATNAHRLSDFDLERGIRQAIRLNRRNPAAPVGAPDTPTWIPSRSMKIVGEAPLCAAILDLGALSVGCELRSVRPFEAAPRACPRCLQYGHMLRYCRNEPLCRSCRGPHLSSACPHRARAGPDAGSRDAADPDPSPRGFRGIPL